MNIEKFSKYSSPLLRTGIAIIFFWFGFSQLNNPSSWTRMIPDYVTILSPTTLIYINGTIEVILASLLLLGLFTRVVALLLALHLLHIVTILGYGANGARDLSLSIATFAIFLKGSDEYCLERYIKKN